MWQEMKSKKNWGKKNGLHVKKKTKKHLNVRKCEMLQNMISHKMWMAQHMKYVFVFVGKYKKKRYHITLY